jgi:predicted CoA-binding protein
MTEMNEIERFLGRKRFAMVGVSRHPKDFSRSLFRAFREKGYDPVPVNPGATEIDGRPCFAKLQDVAPAVDAALLMTSPAQSERVVRDCAGAGIRQVWMYRAGGSGAVSVNAVAFCRSSDIAVIPGECPMMFLGDTGWVHRFHGFVRKITGSYPRAATRES